MSAGANEITAPRITPHTHENSENLYSPFDGKISGEIRRLENSGMRGAMRNAPGRSLISRRCLVPVARSWTFTCSSCISFASNEKSWFPLEGVLVSER